MTKYQICSITLLIAAILFECDVRASCVALPAKVAFKRADAVFVGKVLSSTGELYATTNEIGVEKWFKGPRDPILVVQNHVAFAGGEALQVGQRYFILAKYEPGSGELQAGDCRVYPIANWYAEHCIEKFRGRGWWWRSRLSTFRRY